MVELPENIISKIMLYNSHPVADLFKQELEEVILCFDNEENTFVKVWQSFKHDDDEDTDDFKVCGICAAILPEGDEEEYCFDCLLRDAISGDNYLIDRDEDTDG